MAKTNPDSYYDIEFEVDEILLKSGLIEDIFYLKDLKQRKLFIASNISQEIIKINSSLLPCRSQTISVV